MVLSAASGWPGVSISRGESERGSAASRGILDSVRIPGQSRCCMELIPPGASVSTSVNGDTRSFPPILRLFREKFLSNECSSSVHQRNEINYAFFGQYTLCAQQLCELKLMLSERERG